MIFRLARAPGDHGGINMPNPYFHFKQFSIHQDRSAMKVCTDSCLFGAWVASMRHSDEQVKNVLDIGAGTGLLSLMLAQVLQAEIHAVEMDALSAKQASENIQASPWADRISVHLEDIRMHHPLQPYDLILSNPPFYETDLHSPDARINQARHDTGLMLGELLQVSARLMADHGKLYVLLPASRWKDAEHYATESGWRMNRVCTVRQTAKHQPFRVMLGLSKNDIQPTQKEEIIIRNGNQQYSGRFAELLSPYYQKL